MQLVRTSENYRLRLLVSNERSMEPLFLEYKSNSISHRRRCFLAFVAACLNHSIYANIHSFKWVHVLILTCTVHFLLVHKTLLDERIL